MPIRMVVGLDMERDVRALQVGKDAMAALFAQYSGIHADAFIGVWRSQRGKRHRMLEQDGGAWAIVGKGEHADLGI